MGSITPILVGALLFGGITIMQFAGQARGWAVPAQVLVDAALPRQLSLYWYISRETGNCSGELASRSLGKNFCRKPLIVCRINNLHIVHLDISSIVLRIT